jgi:hypothetical protein
MNMLQLMINQLAGLNPLQNKILMYCLDSPSAAAMKPICAQIEAKRQEQDQELSENEATAWRYYKAEIKSTKRRKMVRSYLGWCTVEELKLIKNQDPNLRAEQEQIVKRISKTYLDLKISDLTEEEENGTPTGVIMRKYIKNLTKKGYTLVENETIWAKFSGGEIISGYNRRPLTTRQVKPEVLADLTEALNELTELRDKQYYKNC